MSSRGNGEGSVYRRKDGRHVAAWTEQTPSGPKRRQVYAATEAEAKRRLTAALRRNAEGRPGLDSRMALSAWIDHWKTSTLPLEGLSLKSVQVYKDVLRLHVVPVIGAVPLRELRASHIELVLATMADKDLSRNYQHQAHKALSKCLSTARRDRLMAYDPMDGVKAPRGGEKARTVPDRAQVLALIDKAPDARMRAFVAVLAFTGLRIDEALTLTWSDVSLDTATIRVAGKAGKRRAVPISRRLAVELASWRKAQAAERLAAAWWDHEADFVLSSEVGTKWESHNARKRFRPLAQKVCPGLTPHGLRHATATVLLEEGVPMKVVSELLGHSSTRITEDVYSHVTARLVQAAADALDRALDA